jgi:hypothetical protein
LISRIPTDAGKPDFGLNLVVDAWDRLHEKTRQLSLKLVRHTFGA